MARNTWKWTRERYKKADSLCRFITRNLYELPPEPPRLVQRYFDLWGQHPQKDDPLRLPMACREHYRRDGDIPF